MIAIDFTKYNIFVTLLLGVIVACQILCHIYGIHNDMLFTIFIILVSIDIGVYIGYFGLTKEETKK